METRILIVDDDPFICRQLEELYTSQRYAVASRAELDRGAAPPRRAGVRARGRRPQDSRHRRHRPHARDPRPLARPRRHHDHRLRQHQRRGRGDQAGRQRLHHEAVPEGGDPPRDGEDPREAPPARRDQLPPQPALRPLLVRQHGEPQPRHARDLRDHQRARAERRDGADLRRVGHRQGAGGARDPLPGQAQERALRRHQLRGVSRTRCSRASSSATSAARSPARSTTASARSSCRAAARCSSTKSRASRSTCS